MERTPDTRRIGRRLPFAALGLFCASFAFAEAPQGDVARWAAALAEARPGSDEARTARVALRASAAGAVDHPATREATFALAEHGAASDDPAGRRESVRAMAAAVSLYPDDPRVPPLLPTLARRQLALDDPIGAYLSLTRMLDDAGTPVDPRVEIDAVLLARAADAAATAGDHARAYSWAENVDVDGLEREHRERRELARLKAGERLNRFDVALEAAAWLREHGGEVFRTDHRALLASARVHEATGLFDEAVNDYERFANLFPDLYEFEDVLLEAARLLIRMGEPSRARIFLLQLADGERLAHLARLELLEIDGAPAHLDELGQYLDILRGAGDIASMMQVADRTIQRYIAAGYPLELFAALSRVAHETPRGSGTEGLVPMVARSAAERALEPVVRLLAARENHLGIAAVSVDAESLELLVPADVRDVVAAARRTYGLTPLPAGPLETAIERAERTLAEGDADAAIELLEKGFERDPQPWPPTAAEARRVLAEALWRADRADEALEQIEKGLAAVDDDVLVRPLHVLRADVLFSRREIGPACAAYREASKRGRSEWVASQLGRCPEGPS